MAPALRRSPSLLAEVLGIADSVGTIAEGMVADLVLLDANPLEDVAAVREIVSVLVRGSLLDRAALDAALEDVLRMPDLRENDWPRDGWVPPEQN